MVSDSLSTSSRASTNAVSVLASEEAILLSMASSCCARSDRVHINSLAIKGTNPASIATTSTILALRWPTMKVSSHTYNLNYSLVVHKVLINNE